MSLAPHINKQYQNAVATDVSPHHLPSTHSGLTPAATGLREPRKTAALLTGTAGMQSQVRAETVDDLITRIQSADDSVRGAAWQGAATAGAAAIQPLSGLLTHVNYEIARAAKRALYRIIRHAGRPGARREAEAVEKELLSLLRSDSVLVRREALWLLSEIGGNRAIAPMAKLLSDPPVREDARCALTRLPGRKVTAALRSAFTTAPEDFRFALAESLRARGERVAGYPSKKLLPKREPPSPTR